MTFYAIEISIKEMASRLEDVHWFANHTHVDAVSTHPKARTVRLCYIDKQDAIEALGIAKMRYESAGEVVLQLDDVPAFIYNRAKKKKEKGYS